jgi:ABC-type oligopeptide transport system substrate-binding subunit
MKKMIKWFSLALAALSLSAMLAACAPSSIENAKAKMVKAGYDVNDTLTDGFIEGCVGGFTASEGLLSDDKLTAYFFESTDAAKAYAEKRGDSVTQKGKWVFSGSKDAIEDFLAFGL